MRKKLAIVLAAALTFNSFGAFADELAIDDIAIEDSFEDAEEFAEEEVVEEDEETPAEEYGEDSAEDGVEIDEIALDDAGFIIDDEVVDFEAEDNASATSVEADARVDIITGENGSDSRWDTSLHDAITAFTASSTEKDVIIRLRSNATLGGATEVVYPMTIELNGYRITDLSTSLTPAVKAENEDRGNICRNDIYENGVLTKIVFAEHEYSTVYNWADNANGTNASGGTPKRYVASVTEACANCGVRKYEADADLEITVNNVKYTTEYQAADSTTTPATKEGYKFAAKSGTDTKEWNDFEEITASTVGYKLKSGYPSFKKVGGVEQHDADGMPIVEATLIENRSQQEVPGTVTIREATQAEIAAANLTNAIKNASCTQAGTKGYYVIVTDPDNTELYKGVMIDTHATEQLKHTAGALKGFQFLKKNGGDYESEAAARIGAGPKTVVKVTSEVTTVGDTDKTYYYYWTWDTLKPIDDAANGATKNSISASTGILNVVDMGNYIDMNTGAITYRPVFYCDLVAPSDGHKEVTGSTAELKPLPDATTNAEYKAITNKSTSYSSCTNWFYPGISITYEFSKNLGDVVKSTATYSNVVKKINGWNNFYYSKPASAYSHVSDGTKFSFETEKANGGHADAKQPTCETEGKAYVVCAICQSASEVAVSVEKLQDTFGAAPEALRNTTVDASVITKDSNDKRKAKISADGLTATIEASCLVDGAVYKYCTGENNKNTPHWVFSEKIAATGHDLSTIVVPELETWSNGRGQTVTNSNIEIPAEAGNVRRIYDSEKDYVYVVKRQCKNAGCDGEYVVYHSSKAGIDTATNFYGAITVVNQDKGDDCQTHAKTTYTVDGLTYTNGDPVKFEYEKVYKDDAYADNSDTLKNGQDIAGLVLDNYGDHVYQVTSWNWAADYKTATVTAKCTVNGCGQTALSQIAKVTEETASNGVTTFTATFGESTQSKTAYTLKGAKVTYDTAAITDGNLVQGSATKAITNGVYGGYASQVPEVTVTLNGTVLDPDVYTVTWTQNSAASSKVVTALVNWNTTNLDTQSVDGDFTSYKKTDERTFAVNDKYTVANNKTFAAPTTTVYENGAEADLTNISFTPKYTGATEQNWGAGVSAYYDLNTAYSLVTKTAVKDATVKYAVSDENILAATKKSAWDDDASFAAQRRLEALDYSLDTVEDIKDVGNNYVYVKLEAEGYTTAYYGVGYINIAKKPVIVYVDNAKVVEGDTPNLHIRAVEYSILGGTITPGKEVSIDQKDFTITTVGGESLDNLKVGTYRLRVTADNYDIYTDTQTYVATLEVLAKDSSTAEDQAKAESVTALINALDENSSVEDVAAARKAYDALSDAAKSRVDADTLKKLTDAEKAVADEAAEAAKKAAIEAANTAAGNAEGAAEAAAVTPNAENLKAAADAVAAAEKAIADAKAAGATDADLAEAAKATAIAKADQAAAAAVADPSKANVDAANAAVAAAKAAGATDNELTTALKNQSAAAAANKEAVEKAVAAANTAAQKAASTGSEADIKAAQAAIDAAKKAGATDAQLADANKNLKAGQEKLAAATSKKNATVKASKSTVKKGKKATVKITSDSTGKITVTAKNKKAKNKKFVKIKKNGKVVFTKKAKKGTYKFTVKVAAAGNYKATTKVIKIKVK